MSKSPALCKNPDCPSTGTKKVAVGNDYCRRCYQAEYRSRKVLEVPASAPVTMIDANLAQFAKRQYPALRKAAIRRLLDRGLSEPEVYAAFAERPELQRFIDGLTNAVVAIRRDLAVLREEDKDKPQLVL